jgi:hypothetical protein
VTAVVVVPLVALVEGVVVVVPLVVLVEGVVAVVLKQGFAVPITVGCLAAVLVLNKTCIRLAF